MATTNATRALQRATLGAMAPVLTPQQAALIVQREQEGTFVQNQSFGLTLAIKAGDFFVEVSSDHAKAETLAHLVPAVRDHIEKLRALADILESAIERAAASIELHDDGADLLAAAAAEAAIARAAASARGVEGLL